MNSIVQFENCRTFHLYHGFPDIPWSSRRWPCRQFWQNSQWPRNGCPNTFFSVRERFAGLFWMICPWASALVCWWKYTAGQKHRHGYGLWLLSPWLFPYDSLRRFAWSDPWLWRQYRPRGQDSGIWLSKWYDRCNHTWYGWFSWNIAYTAILTSGNGNFKLKHWAEAQRYNSQILDILNLFACLIIFASSIFLTSLCFIIIRPLIITFSTSALLTQ